MTTLPNTQTRTASSRATTRTDWLFYGLVGIAAGLIFLLQAPNTGFYGPNHGWTSSHGLAIMSHATPGNGFVGYALQFRGEDGAVTYDYFDRYPFFFSAAMGALLSVTDSLPAQVALARYAMAAVYAGTLLVAGLLAHTMLGNRWRALAAVMLAFSGWWLVFYKDMVHYDQPALFGNFLLLYAIARYQQGGGRGFVYAAALIAVSLGRGYSSYMILALWTALALIPLQWPKGEKKVPLPQGKGFRVRAFFPILVFALAMLWGGAFLGYNLVMESVQRGVPLTETSIVDSAVRRLPVFGEKEAGRTVGKDVLPWDEFAVVESARLVRWTLPVRVDEMTGLTWAFGAGMLAVVVGYIATQKRRLIAFLTAFWGVAWLAFMINLAHGHEYVVMYGIGLPLVFYIALMNWLPRSRWLTGAALGVAFAALAYSHGSVRALLSGPSLNRAVYTADYNRIAQRIEGSGRSVHVNISDGLCVIEDDFCYVLGFYLSEHFLSPASVAEYTLSRLPTYFAYPLSLPPGDTDGVLLAADTLTPENTTAHLFDMAAAQRRTLPDDLNTIVTFGEALSLQNWALRGDVSVPPCGRVHVESWWQTERELPTNYSMQLALVNAEGAGVAASNYDLSLLPTGVWVPGRYHLDSRPVNIPCDLPPGEYPLVMSVYDPNADGSLTVFNAEGQPTGDFLYLTTLFINEG